MRKREVHVEVKELWTLGTFGTSAGPLLACDRALRSRLRVRFCLLSCFIIPLSLYTIASTICHTNSDSENDSDFLKFSLLTLTISKEHPFLFVSETQNKSPLRTPRHRPRLLLHFTRAGQRHGNLACSGRRVCFQRR